MPVFKVNIKWGKEKFTDIECNTEETPELFKAQLFALSGVQPDRQKVMIKGAVIKDDSWGNIKLKDGVTLLMMGTADALPQAPVDKPIFMEDMTESQLASALEVPPGLNNLGNTCYMNATLQCLRSVPELRDTLRKFHGGMMTMGSVEVDQSITAGIRDLFDNMDTTANSIPPIVMLQVLHMCYPQFAEKAEGGQGYQQQDANECWTELIRCMQKKLPALEGSQAGVTATGGNRGFIDQYFGGEFEVTMKCIEAEDESPTKSTESFYQLSCFIEKEVKYLHTGLKNRLEEHVSKHSTSLDRDAQYTRKSRLNRIPAYLAIQMVRFFYKEKDNVNAKILKDIKFQLSLDVFDLCSEELQQKLIPMRSKFKEQEDILAELKIQGKAEGDIRKDINKKEVKDESKIRREPFNFTGDPGSNNSGYYELQAVLTHKGRSSSSGHYVAWVRRKGDEWFMFDDDKVHPVPSEDILKLSGGGDWHCAYVLLYGPRILEIDESLEENGKVEKTKSTEENKTTESSSMETS